jgi:bifunctional DNA-binding transcriptional regulator/antitoxin component of YhaV-PrlF toxin-antitoxin module
MTQNGKTRTVLKDPKKAWNTFQSMEVFGSKGAIKHLGLETTLSSRNQITIPLRLIRGYGLRVGDKIRFLRLAVNGKKSRISAEVTGEGKRLIRLQIRIEHSNVWPYE